MSFNTVKKTIGGKDLIIETGKMAKQADGSVVIRCGGDALLVTACMSDDPLEGASFFPMTVNYLEKYYASGKIPGGYLKREAKPSDRSTLIARSIDRPIRPMFLKEFTNELQIMVTTLSVDKVNPVDIFGLVGTSAALAISRIPYLETVAAVRIAYLNGEYLVNPTFQEVEDSQMDIVVAGTKGGITMVEGGAKEVGEDILLKAMEIAKENINVIIDLIQELVNIIKPVKYVVPTVEKFLTDELAGKLRDFAYPKFKEANVNPSKSGRKMAIKAITKEALSNFEITKEEAFYGEAKDLLGAMEEEVIRTQVLDEGIRADGRKGTEIRDITVEVDLLDVVHGSALFTRGQTQSLGIITLGSVGDNQYIDDIEREVTIKSNFMLHYNFPAFSVGEVKRSGPPSRREIGHGNLAKRAIEPMIPTLEEFPYTIRMVSEVLESNGSSSMATVCSASLSMMAAGVPIKKAVAGIAMGMVWDKEQGKYVILSDIQGLEDHHGDMDFKVAGTSEGITAFQMDVKTIGISSEMMAEAMAQAKEGRMHILGKMNEVISTSRNTVAKDAPKVGSLKIPADSIGSVIGPGGKHIKKIQEVTESDINISEDGSTNIYCNDADKLAQAIDIVKHFAFGFTKGEAVEGPVIRVEPYGVFIEMIPGHSALLHKSQFAQKGQPEDIFKLGDIVKATIRDIDERKRESLTQQ